ncbi:MAG: AarF/ABC1/UbiB kinase family protein [Bacteriovorax sp.]|nr:AarF/ABC1/UbiB kinase family protein [Bacteriovorax sp.]
MKTIKSTFLQRAPKLLKTSFQLATGKNLDSMVEQLSELKGVPQKLGQLLSMDVTQFIPDELKEKLKPLQGSGKALEASVLLGLLKRELSSEQYSSITHFEQTPLGAGSIGQVHQASLLGHSVVFKIQYPEIEKSILADLALLGPMTALFEMVRPETRDFSIMLKEVKAMLLNELDYELEVKNMLFFKEAMKGDDRYHVPSLIPEYSRSKIICMDYIEGVSLGDFIESSKKDKTLEARTLVAHAMLDLFIEEFFHLGLVQTDPNFANYLIRNGDQIVLLDFGAVKEFDSRFRKKYFLLLKAAIENNDDDILRFGEDLGLVSSADKTEAVELFVTFMKEAMSYFRKENNPMNFRDEKITGRLLEMGWKLWKVQRISSPNANLIFLHRKLGGLFSLLKEMQISIDLYPYWEKMEKFNQ